jgi:hypothetical protein
MPAVQKIACVNHGGFVMRFHVDTSTGLRTGYTGWYPVDQSKTIDLGQVQMPEGTEIWPVVDAQAGDTHSGPRVTFARNGQTATYVAKGTTLSYSVKLIGGGTDAEGQHEAATA